MHIPGQVIPPCARDRLKKFATRQMLLTLQPEALPLRASPTCGPLPVVLDARLVLAPPGIAASSADTPAAQRHNPQTRVASNQRSRGVGSLPSDPVLPNSCMLHSRALHSGPSAPERRGADADKASSCVTSKLASGSLRSARSRPMAQARVR